jgi:uncharacterized membrane protein
MTEIFPLFWKSLLFNLTEFQKCTIARTEKVKGGEGGGFMDEKEKSSTGLDENVAAFLCYLFGFITGIVFLVVEKKSRFVKFHAMQSTITFLGLLVISIILGWIPVIGVLILVLSLVLWLLLMIKALQGIRYSLPIVGKMAEGKSGQ